MGKGDGFVIVNGSSIDAATLELVKECLVVIGSHTGPASALHLSVENGSCSGKRQSRVLIGNLHVCETQSITNVINVLLHNFLFLMLILSAS